MLRIKFKSPLIAMIAICGIAAGSAFAQGTPAPGGHGGHGPGPGSGGHQSPAPAPGGHGGGYHPPAPTPYHPPAPNPGNHGGNHPPAPTPYHPPAPTPGGHGGYHPPAPTPYHPPAPSHGGHGGGYAGGGHFGYPVGHPHGPGYSYGHDHYGNIVSPNYNQRIDLGRRRMDDMRRDDRVRTWVDRRSQEFRLRDHDILIRDNDRFAHDHVIYRDRYKPWWSQGFYGGYYWDFHPNYDIDTYFYNPVVYWFYGSDQDEYFYNSWYGPTYTNYPVFRSKFRYNRVFFPTEEFRDLNLGVSSMDIDAQANYLDASTVLGDRLALEVQNRGGAELGENAVVVDHYQVLPDDKGVVIEGFVDQDDVQFAFKAVQDLSNPEKTTLFAATADEDLSDDGVDRLQQINTQIEDLGGVAEGTESAVPSDDGATVPSDDGTSQWDDQNGSN